MNPVRLKGRLVEYGTSGDSFWKTPPVDTIGTIELLPLDREPRVGNEVLVRVKVENACEDGSYFMASRRLGYSDTVYLDKSSIVSILPPTEEKCECKDYYSHGGGFRNSIDCSVHGSKREEECDMVGEWEDCPKCHQPHYGENPKEDSK